jgi:hypothetical protein
MLVKLEVRPASNGAEKSERFFVGGAGESNPSSSVYKTAVLCLSTDAVELAPPLNCLCAKSPLEAGFLLRKSTSQTMSYVIPYASKMSRWERKVEIYHFYPSAIRPKPYFQCTNGEIFSALSVV